MRILQTIIVLSLIGDLGSEGRAETYWESGTNCRADIWTVAPPEALIWQESAYPWTRPDVAAYTAGSSNTNTTQVSQISCALPWTQSTGPTANIAAGTTRVFVRDNNSVAGSAGAIRCFTWYMTNTGSYSVGQNVYSCGTYGGCTSAPAGSYVSTTDVAEYLDVPGQAVTGAISAYWLTCVLPPKTSSTLYSGLLGYNTPIAGGGGSYFFEPATQCRRASTSIATDITWCSNSAGNRGLCNHEGSWGDVVCPLAWSQPSSGDANSSPGVTTLYFVDSSSANAVGCRLVAYRGDGTAAFGAWRYSCSTVGGCTAPQRFSTGYRSLTLTPPVALIGEFAGYEVACSLPPNTGAPSGVVGYVTQF